MKITGSSAFSEANYNAATNQLTVTYHNSKETYTYENVTPAGVATILNSASYGKSLKEVIKGKSFKKHD